MKITSSLTLFFFAFSSIAYASSVKELTEVQDLAAKRKDFRVKFTQESFSALRKSVSKKPGELFFSPPNSFRYEISDKKKQEVYVSNGKVFWIYSELTRHAQKLPPEKTGTDFIDLIVKMKSIESRYTVEPWEGAQSAQDVMSDDPPARTLGKLLVKLIPKDAKSQQEKIFMKLDTKSGNLEELRIVYKRGNRWRISFDNYVNEKNDAKVFQFTPPPGTAVDSQ